MIVHPGMRLVVRNETKRNGRKQDVIGSSGGKLISFRYLLVSLLLEGSREG